MKKLSIFMFIVLSSFVLGCASCQKQPDKEDYSLTACYNAADCLYRNQDNKDKSICMDFISECNAFSKYEFCKKAENRPDDMTFKECWLYLNQK